ncbi:MAG: DUF368 domain-containing protein [Firmicutes bacterium]|nr:DUF368 domain-containing protein [Dethiobacter sp.]MBS3889047.1 DUF368 domain-containing protein [Bacillota bacterium]MBS4053763.1 DUF368 domain-containing protein [Thermaerobacter sp.]
MRALIQGFILGLVVILPGMSGGTVFLIMGLYEKMIADLVRFNLRPYVPIFGGMVVGIFVGGTVFALVFERFRDVTVAFLFGSLLASVRAVLGGGPSPSVPRVLAMLAGLAAGLIFGAEPMMMAQEAVVVSPLTLLIGGALSTAAMVLPGVPGSSILIIMGIYDTMLYYIKEMILGQLAIFAVGSVGGLFLLAYVLDKLYARYRDLLSYFFAGLILGSTRALLPTEFTLFVVLSFVVGFMVMWPLGGKGQATT